MTLTMGKVRQVINLDPEINVNFQKESLVLMTKATEAFMSDLGGVLA